MKKVFADTLYWVATINPDDPWVTPVKHVASSLANAQIVTTEEVFIEVLNAVSGGGSHLRQFAVQTVNFIRGSAKFHIIPQSSETFLDGIRLYERRLDKGYSLTDCISMTRMRQEGITEVLTNDHHFEQEGFRILIKREENR